MAEARENQLQTTNTSIAKKAQPMNVDDLFNDNTMMMVMMMTVMMLMLGQLFKIAPAATSAQQYYATQLYRGVEDKRILNADGTMKWIDLLHTAPNQPWIWALIINNGPDTVLISTNTPDLGTEILPGASATIDKRGAMERINVLFYQCNPGTAELLVTGEY